MSMAHICHGQDGVGIGVGVLQHFGLGTGCRSHTAELLLLWLFYALPEDLSTCKQLGFGGSLMELVELL